MGQEILKVKEQEAADEGFDLIRDAVLPSFVPAFLGIALLSAAAALLFAACLMMTRPGERARIPFDPQGEGTEYSYVYAQFLTDCYAFSDGQGARRQKFYFVMDPESQMYVVRLSDEKFEELKDLYEYTFAEGGEAPSPVRLSGIPSPLPEELLSLSIRGYNELMGETVLTEENAAEYIGTRYLDCTRTPFSGKSFWLFYGALIAALLGGVLLFLWGKRYFTASARLRALPAGPSWDPVYARAAKDDALFFPRSAVVMTEEEVIGGADRTPVILPYREITSLSRRVTGKKKYDRKEEILLYAGEEEHLLLSLPVSRNNQPEIDDLYQELQERTGAEPPLPE